MPIFAMRFDRPDKRAPMIAYFEDRRDADRTIQSILHMTAKDYGSSVHFFSPSVGYALNLQRLVDATGETRLTGSIRQFESAPEGCRVSPTARRIVVWERATAEMCQHWEHGERVRPWVAKPKKKERPATASMKGMSGAEKFALRRAEARAGAYKKL